ncbi:hypothetical protein HanIR_Chr10g0497411 [Helianthus annuus]|nr:hypothetical protein HanIR_Chr10g0497411 [Helianthus annuus]
MICLFLSTSRTSHEAWKMVYKKVLSFYKITILLACLLSFPLDHHGRRRRNQKPNGNKVIINHHQTPPQPTTHHPLHPPSNPPPPHLPRRLRHRRRPLLPHHPRPHSPPFTNPHLRIQHLHRLSLHLSPPLSHPPPHRLRRPQTTPSPSLLVDTAFGRLRARWGILSKEWKEESIESFPYVVVTCCLLHNFLIKSGEEFPDEDSEYTRNHGLSDYEGEGDETGERIRSAIASHLSRWEDC